MKINFTRVLALSAIIAMPVCGATTAAAGWFSSSKAASGEKAADVPAEETQDASKWTSPRFRHYDADQDGKISLEEFLKDQTDAFKARDENKDGSLSPDEFDFPPGISPDAKIKMRKNMMEEEERQKKAEADMRARVAENAKKAEEQQKTQAEEAAKKAAEAKAEGPKAQEAKTAKTQEPKAKEPKAEEPKQEAVKPAAKKPAAAPVKKPAAANVEAKPEIRPETKTETQDLGDAEDSQ